MEMNRLTRIFLGNSLICAAYAWITVPNGIINGGVTSFSMSLNVLTDGIFSVSIWASILTVLIALLCYIFLGREYFTGSLLSCLFFVLLFNFFSSIPLNVKISIYAAVPIAAVVVGAGYYLCLSSKATTVGMDTIAVIIHEKWDRIKVAPCMYAINICVLLLGLYTYGWISVLCGIVFAGLQALVLNTLLSISEKKNQNDAGKK